MRRLVVCCDGTWNTPGQLAVTNVRRLCNALAETTENGAVQLTHYQSGVGAESGAVSGWFVGGVAGVGLSGNVLEAYHWLSTTYRPEDRIALFGFSRGAYTARSLAGMIAACGLIDTTGLDETVVERQIRQSFLRQYRRQPAERDTDPGWRDGLRFGFDPEDAEHIPVDFVGVWDTVGAFGIPDTLGWLNALDRPEQYRFHNVSFNPHVRHGRHAVALDERRGPFTPTLWSDLAAGQDVKQVWFPGSHMDVGGGHPQTGLSDGALQWMIDESRDAIGLGFRPEVVDQIRPDPLGVLHDDNQGVYGLLEPLYEPLLRPLLEPFFDPRPRATPRIDDAAGDGALHPSVYLRYRTPPITSGPYRHTRTLAPGQFSTVGVSARDPWNWTGIYLEPGEYTFRADGRWNDHGITSGPEGTPGWPGRNPRAAVRFAGTVLGQGERVFRRVSRNPNANFLLTRRDDDVPWMSLIGVVANGSYEQLNGGLDRHERITIGTGTTHRVQRGGYLYAYANDAWGFYGNNSGQIELTVERTP